MTHRGFLLFKRRETPRWQHDNRPLDESRIQLGERWEVPKGAKAPLLLKAHLDLTLTGKLVRFLYRVIPPTLRVEYHDGKVVDHRLAWLNSQRGFLLSDLPRDDAAVKLFLRAASAIAYGPSLSSQMPHISRDKSSFHGRSSL